MSKLRTFVRRHILWVGFFAVAIPLTTILALQYRSLRKLEKTSSVYEQVWMKNYLADVSKEVKFFYRTNAEQVLNVAASSITAENLHKTKYHFGKCETEGAKRLFIAVFRAPEGDSQILFFDPHDQSRITDVPAEEMRAANVASAPFKLLGQEGTPLRSLALTDDMRDPDNRMLLKPITDEASKVVGVAGMIIDREYFLNQFLPRAIQNSLPKFFPDDAQHDVIVTVRDANYNLLYSTQPLGGENKATADIAMIWPSYFYDYQLGIRSRHMTPEQWAHWNFNFNLAVSLLMTIVLIGGIALALRTASREMRLSQMKTDFVSNVSHELRTPLSSIRVFGEFLKLGRVKDEEKMQEYGEYIETESRRLTQLINNILDFSKIESDRKTYHFERANLGELICATLKTFDVQLKQHGFRIDFDAPAAPLPPVLVDPEAIAQAFTNLLDNAVKYSGDAREIRVSLSSRGECVYLSVKDFGVGIPREEQGKIFEKFYRVSTGLVHDVKGSGLGLSLVEHIVKAHRGRVAVESEPGRGSTFTIQLPVAATTKEHAETPEKPTPLLGGDTSLGFGLKQ
ncbi:MAG TPA: HAMP domain-containing sensor histidine kinase [Pyrinomonadaceae bacterium]|jgi:signal transduction histidine kinase|nr:HAMP domain-containing sensor histidine kinase [Pyrinomonadaceae bacterium]